MKSMGQTLTEDKFPISSSMIPLSDLASFTFPENLKMSHIRT